MAKAKQKGGKGNSKPAKRKKKVQLAGQPNWMSNTRLHLILLFAVAFLLYANTFGHDYTQDDAIVITDNVYTTQGVKGFGGILQYDTFYGFFQEEGKAKLVAGGRYRPFSLLTFALEYSIFGKNPMVSHIVNALCFAFTSILIYLLLLQMLPTNKYGTQGYFIALGAALLFAVHPIHTEAVANIKGRDEILALMGSLGALYFAIRAIKESNSRLHLWGALCLFAALMSKENAITFLAIIPLSYYYFTKVNSAGQLIQSSLPYLGAAVAFILIRSSILGFSFGDPSMELMNNPFLRFEGGRYVPIAFGAQLATVMFTLGKYLLLLFVPHPLTHDYYPRQIELMSWGNPWVIISLLLYIGLLVYAIRGLRKKDLLAYGILFYLLTLSIVSNIIFPIGTNMAERLLFMPSVGFCVAIAVLLYRLGKLMAPGKNLKNFKQLQIPLILAGVFMLGLAIKTISRNPVWKDNYTLFTTDIQNSPNSAKLRNAVGGELITQFYNSTNEQEKQARMQEAIGHLQEAVRLHPLYKNAYLLMGNAHFYLKEYDNAIAAYRKAIDLDPGYAEALKNMGIAYRDGGQYFGQQLGDINKAVGYLQQAMNYLPNDYETFRLLGVAYGMSGNGQQAVEYFDKAAQANPESADAWYNLGTAYLSIGNAELGNSYRQRAISMDPGVVQRLGQ